MKPAFLQQALKRRFLGSVLAVGAFAGATYGVIAQGGGSAGPTVTVDISSLQDGAVLAPGAFVEWRLHVSVSQGDNLGLALISADVSQDPGNPTIIDLQRGIPNGETMRAFDHPDGLTNPGPGTQRSGFGGTQFGPPGKRNLIQIGGAQNTFGVAPPALGPNGELERGLDVDVLAGVGQGPGSLRFASGKLRAPNMPGTYTLRVHNVVANVLAEVNAPPQASRVVRANGVAGNDTITFTVL